MSMSKESFKKCCWIGGLVLLVFCVFTWIVDIEKVKANEVGVVYKIKGGVQDVALRDGWQITTFGKIDTVNIGTQKLSFAKQMADDTAGEDTADNEYERIEVACGTGGGQKAWITLTMNYHIKPEGAVQMYRDGIHKTYRYVVLKRTAIDVVNQIARSREALDIYSGVGFNALRDDVETALREHPLLESRGIVVENATIMQVDLSDAYETEIEAKQLARQSKLRAIEDTKAAEEKARQAKAEAQAMVEQRTAEANAKKIENVKAAEAQAEAAILAAEANKMKVVLEAEANAATLEQRGIGEMKRDQAAAQGVLALGEAEAKVEELKRNAKYEGEAGLRRATVEVAQYKADVLKNLVGGANIIPENAFMALATDGTQMPVALTKEIAD